MQLVSENLGTTLARPIAGILLSDTNKFYFQSTDIRRISYPGCFSRR